MKSIILNFILFLAPFILLSQKEITFVIHMDQSLSYDSIYISGPIPRKYFSTNEKYRLKDYATDAKKITLSLKGNSYTYHYHRGSETNTEIEKFGGSNRFREISFTKDTVIHDTIFSWLDHPSDFDTLILSQETLKAGNHVGIDNLNIWKYKKGANVEWNGGQLNVKNWDIKRPVDISEEDYDENGRLEGWFYTPIFVDTSYVNYINFGNWSWAAMDIYLNGELILEYGNTGDNGEPFQEHKAPHTRPVKIPLIPGKSYSFAIHFVDEFSILPNQKFKGPLRFGFQNDEENQEFLKHINEEPIYTTLRLVVGLLLTLLFWMLVGLNPREKTFKIIAIFSTVLTVMSYLMYMPHNPNSSYFEMTLLMGMAPFVVFTIFILIIILAANIFNKKVHWLIKIIFGLPFLLLILGTFIQPIKNITFPIMFILIYILVAIFFYYLISSWRSVKGAKWFIVFGQFIFITLVITLFFLVFFGYQNFDSTNFQAIYLTFLFLSFPVSLVIYVAVRYKEIISETLKKSNEIIKISKEKESLLLNQNERLDKEVKERTSELKHTIDNLRSTQEQLIQAEKMASLGELTAGIAHEIKNPLNFVNNFAEVSNELLDDMNEELEQGDIKEAKEISKDLKLNLEKITHHGKRADAIVKSMLQHSRTSSGEKQPTDINALCDEYLRLAYHGLRAKDKSFNAAFETTLDPDLPKVNVVPQDIGRVLLNLINNAFQAVGKFTETQDESYIPKVIVSTRSLENKVEIRIEDNGPGIPDDIQHKIFQPFFTTKPAGEGTGLGLSLSYDIVKAHGGELKVISQVGSGSVFSLKIPIA